jgi:putative addiction module antidote
MYKTKLRKIGKSKGVILPKELLDKMSLSEGDQLFVRETRAGYMITPYNEEVEKQLNAAKKGISKYRNALKILAE